MMTTCAGRVGAPRVRTAASATSPAVASAISGVWNAPETGMGRTFFAPSSLAKVVTVAMASEVPAMTTWPGAL